MAVPRYESQTKPLDPIRPARTGAPANPMGAVLEGASNAVSGFARMADQAATMRAEGQLNDLQEKVLGLRQKIKSFRGKNAFEPEAFGGESGSSLTDTSLRWFDEAASKAKEGLTGYALKAFDQGAERFRLEFGGFTRSHESRETEVLANDTYAGVMVREDETLAQAGVSEDGRLNGEAIKNGLSRKVHAANQLSDFLGEPKELREAREIKATSSAHAIVIDGLLKAGNANGAEVYYKLNKDQIEKRQSDALEREISQNILASDVQIKAQDLEKSGAPLVEKLAKVDEMAKGKPELLKALRAEVLYRDGILESAKEKAVQEVKGKLWGMRFPVRPGQVAVSPGKISKSKEWNSDLLDDEDRNRLEQAWASELDRRRARAEGRSESPKEEIRQKIRYLNLIKDPEFSQMSDEQLESLHPYLGEKYTFMAISDRKAPKAAKVNAKLVEEIAIEAGITDKNKISELFAAGQEEMQNNPQQWDIKKQRELYMGLAKSVILKPSVFLGFGGEKKPFFEARTEVMVPPSFASDFASRAGKRPTEAQILSAWIEHRQSSPVPEDYAKKVRKVYTSQGMDEPDDWKIYRIWAAEQKVKK